MSVKTNLLIFCVVFCQGTLGTLSEKDIDKSSELLVRQKRVINRLPDGDVKELIKNTPYVVSIKPYRILRHCVGTIMTKHIVLTIAKCVEINRLDYYRVYSGTARITGRYTTHSIIDKRILVGIHPHRPTDGIALIKVFPPFVYSRSTFNIPIYDRPIHPGRVATVSGWGCNPEGDLGTEHPDHLRSINVPIISNAECARLYESHSMISEVDICTLDVTDHQYCGANDGGAPLVVKEFAEPFLAGIHLWNRRNGSHPSPDVFINLQYARYRSWISDNIQILEHTTTN